MPLRDASILNEVPLANAANGAAPKARCLGYGLRRQGALRRTGICEQPFVEEHESLSDALHIIIMPV